MRLTDAQVAEIRALHAEGGVGASALADRFAISRSYVHDLLSGRARSAVTAPATPVESSGAMTAAVEEFLAGIGELVGRRAVSAASAGVLARRLDVLAGLGSAAGAM